ncbi:MAG: DNA polymerase III subunit gamma/tau [Clostridiaceae bacterium]|nr:DNA polymerase III subunit gamma/tau [Clostridiaceae bacterium]
MAYTALYREWRPQSFEEVVGQKQVTITLKNQIKSSRIAHAYLLCGTRGTGKTTIAKILSKAVNCLDLQDGEPCNACAMCLKVNSGTAIDVVEMDAASHRGIDKMRDIIEDVQYLPTEGKYKVYIIDEVHMLTVEAVNAFLKTLEEPPKNVIFILATTDPQKLPITILSRCQRFNFTRIKNDEIYERLLKIVNKQGVFADDNSLNLISRMCDGAMRDALSILDQAISMGGGKVEYDQVISMLGLVTNDKLLSLSEAIIEKNVEKSMKLIEDIVFGGKDVYALIRDMVLHMRNLMMVKVSNNPEEVVDMSKENIELIKKQSEKIRIEEIMRDIRILQEAEEQSKWSKQSRIYLELAVIKMCKIQYDTSTEVLLSRINKLEKLIKDGGVNLSSERVITQEEKKDTQITPKQKVINKVKSEVIPEEIGEESSVTLDQVKKSWRDILEIFKTRRMMSVYASLITGEVVGCRNAVVQINFPEQYSFSKKRLDKDEPRHQIEEIFSEILKEKIRIHFTIDKTEEATTMIDPEKILIATFGEELVEILDE